MDAALPATLLEQYARFSLYNSPYPAHDGGCAVDLYPGTLENGRTHVAPSPVTGTVLETETVRAPPKPYATDHDHLILLECVAPAPLAGLVARVLHVEPAVEAGDRVERGDSLGRLVRAGFFAPWVDNHLHVGFRRPDQHLHRASGSLALELGVDVQPLAWDGTGTVVATGETYAVLDSPPHPRPGEQFVGLRAEWRSSDRGDADGRVGDRTGTGGVGVLDGGLSHYDGGGIHTGGRSERVAESVVVLNDDRLGVVGPDGRTIGWDDVVVTANDEPITGLSTFCARDGDFGAKLICPDHALAVGDDVCVRVRPRQ
ncbi:hypothetical protein D8Y22_02460 [Salinadaptatus halalkaliphilus]|uniref:M23 family metallopeptidase n=1 Tax=Salinadaptatus halalkaliphilus TaxID=2419781 RepID=A0A4S3TQC3_9EURY|nr:hypothetical protein [Salinadaptatus halalkaliphilus]THE66466.1 hypothetical protein D8Y22_02460 [Salinadaptatus halalkaliphilus]